MNGGDRFIAFMLAVLVFGTLALGGVMVIQLAHQANRTEDVLDRVKEVSCQNAQNNRDQLIAIEDIAEKLGIPTDFAVPAEVPCSRPPP